MPQTCLMPFFVIFPSFCPVVVGSLKALTRDFLGLPANLGSGGGSIGKNSENFWNFGPGTGSKGCL